MQVRLHLRLIRVLAVVVDTLDELVVAVCSTRSWSRCPHCGFRCRRVHDTRLRRIRDLPVSGRAVTLEWQRRRFACDGCGERHLEAHEEFEGRLTRRLARAVVADALVMSVRAVAPRHRLSWPVVMDLVSSWSALVGAHRLPALSGAAGRRDLDASASPLRSAPGRPCRGTALRTADAPDRMGCGDGREFRRCWRR